MAQTVSRWRCGVAIKSDGRDQKDIEKGLVELLKKHTEYANNARRYRHEFSWEMQNDAMKQVKAIMQR
jgi:hypothetical protein